MRVNAFLVVILLVCGAVAVPAALVHSPRPPRRENASPSGTTAASSLTTGPTDVMPTNIAVTVTVGEKDYLGNIPVTFDGGQGQDNVHTITVTMTRADGSTQTETLGSDKGDTITLNGTRGSGSLSGPSDRVQVAVTMNNGITYNIDDVLRVYRSRSGTGA